MPVVADAVAKLEQLAPLALAEPWDNVGLLAGDPRGDLVRVLCCLTLTPDVADEAIAGGASLVVTHHPLPFRDVRSLSTDTIDGGTLWRLCRAGVAVYSAHTAYDSAVGGVNDQWAAGLGLTGVRALVPSDDPPGGAGRIGLRSETAFAALTRDALRVASPAASLRVVPPRSGEARVVAIACGSGGSLLDGALAAGCDALLTGEMSFHDCLRCRSLGVGVILTGHYASERFAVEALASRLADELSGVPVTASHVESDPLAAAP